MKRSTGPGKTADLPDSVHERLNMYALAAGAAGVGMLALTQPAEAKIVYTPAHVWIGLNHKIPLDLNHDGKADFVFYKTLHRTGQGQYSNWNLEVYPTRSMNEILPYNRAPQYASALFRGSRVGPNSPFSPGLETIEGGFVLLSRGSGACIGVWDNVQNRYLGLQFIIKGKRHFGWARMNVNCSVSQHKVTALLTGYAYETIPNKAIITGKTKGPEDSSVEAPSASLTKPTSDPATLGMLALGAPALSIWRRDNSVGATQ
jgi:hypothetical protein